MNNRVFGITALLGLFFLWLSARPARAVGPRTLITSWYGEHEQGKTTASGEIFDHEKLTAASWEYYRKWLRVTGPKGSVVVFCNDKGPARRLLKTRQLDLSRAAFARIADLRVGLVQVTVKVL